jgi:hypothetical protein
LARRADSGHGRQKLYCKYSWLKFIPGFGSLIPPFKPESRQTGVAS